jgi:hypothetical protein
MSDGVVTRSLVGLIAKQVADHRLVVWYDPERAYASAAEALSIPDTTVARYDGSFFKLRHEIDHLMSGLQPPRLVVYVPEDQGRTHHALIELEAAGVVMQPGQQPPQRNTRLSLVARNALRPLLGDETAAEVERQAESGKLSLADLNNLAGKGKEISTGVLALVFGRQVRRRDREERRTEGSADPPRHLLRRRVPRHDDVARGTRPPGPARPAHGLRGRAGRLRAPAPGLREDRPVSQRARPVRHPGTPLAAAAGRP